MRPSRITIRALAVLFLFASAAAVFQSWIPGVLGLAGLFVLAALFDALRTRSQPLELTRHVAGSLALGTWCDVVLRIEGAARPLELEVFDHHPVHGESMGLPQTIALGPQESGELTYRFKPSRRGEWSFDSAEVRMTSRWGLWQRRMRVGEPSPVKVFPDFRAVQRFALLAVDNPLSNLGVKRRQRRGEALELHQLREYRDGDSPRHIDWRATSRRRQLISREFEDERNQNIVFMLDCGRRMRAVDDGLAHFDHALNSVLLLTYVALRQGDAVGLLTLGGTERWLPPQKGGLAMNAVLHTVYDLETDVQAADYAAAAMNLMARQRRRALVVLVSNLRDEDGDEISAAVRLMRKRHLVLLASLRESILDDILDKPIEGFDSALRVGALRHYLDARRLNDDWLSQLGVNALDVTPDQLPVSLVNRYLDIKRAGAL